MFFGYLISIYSLLKFNKKTISSPYIRNIKHTCKSTWLLVGNGKRHSAEGGGHIMTYAVEKRGERLHLKRGGRYYINWSAHFSQNIFRHIEFKLKLKLFQLKSLILVVGRTIRILWLWSVGGRVKIDCVWLATFRGMEDNCVCLG